ncbi:hypothetical protein D9M68_687060 [compost metagenome]
MPPSGVLPNWCRRASGERQSSRSRCRPATQGACSATFNTSISLLIQKKVMSDSGSASWSVASIRRMTSTWTLNARRIRGCWPSRRRMQQSSSGVATASSGRSKRWSRSGAKAATRCVSCFCSGLPEVESLRWYGQASFHGSARSPANGYRLRLSGRRWSRLTSWRWRWRRPLRGRARCATGTRSASRCTRPRQRHRWMGTR